MTAVAARAMASGAPAPARTVWHVIVPTFVAALATAAVLAGYKVFVGTSLGQAVDTAAMRGAEVHHPKVVEILNRALNGTTLASLILVCVAAAAIGIVRRRLDVAVGAAVLVAGANLTSQLLKTHLHRADLDNFPAPNSFPSGHTTAAASVAFALIIALPHAVRGMVALIGAGYVTVIAVATVWAEWHRPSDTVAGLLVVLAWGALVAAVIRARGLRRPGLVTRPTRLTTTVFVIVGSLCGVAGLGGLAAVALAERGAIPDLVSGRFAFLAGSAAITAAVAGIFLIWVRLAAGDPPAASMAVPAEADITGA
jgi:membrane-associated phospholipid phosphatase